MIRIARERGRNRAPRTASPPTRRPGSAAPPRRRRRAAASSFSYAIVTAMAQHLIVRGLKRRRCAAIIERVYGSGDRAAQARACVIAERVGT
jgi:hypothetical protein